MYEKFRTQRDTTIWLDHNSRLSPTVECLQGTDIYELAIESTMHSSSEIPCQSDRRIAWSERRKGLRRAVCMVIDMHAHTAGVVRSTARDMYRCVCVSMQPHACSACSSQQSEHGVQLPLQWLHWTRRDTGADHACRGDATVRAPCVYAQPGASLCASYLCLWLSTA